MLRIQHCFSAVFILASFMPCCVVVSELSSYSCRNKQLSKPELSSNCDLDLAVSLDHAGYQISSHTQQKKQFTTFYS